MRSHCFKGDENMILTQRVLSPEEIASLHYNNSLSLDGHPAFVRLELSVTDDDNLFEDVDMGFKHC